MNVLTAKIQALLRRTYDFAGQTNLIEHRGVILNTSDATLTYQGEKIDLTKNEYKILQLLMGKKEMRSGGYRNRNREGRSAADLRKGLYRIQWAQR